MPDRPLGFLTLLIATLIAVPAWAAAEDGTPEQPENVRFVSPEVAQAVDAIEEGNFTRAAGFLRPAAESGDADAQALLGQLYLDGQGVERDLYEAGRWLRSAASNGSASGAYALATSIADGTLTPPGADPADETARTEEATRLYIAAANAGSVPGKVEAGLRYARGIGVAQDMLAASRWFREAAEAGSPNAQFNLGALHAAGALSGGKPDYEAALPWFRKAAEQGHVDAQYNLGLAAAQGLGRPEDNTEAARWFEPAAKAGLPDAQAALAYLLYQGEGVEKDVERAAALYAAAAEQGHLVAQNRLARLYVMGRGVEADMAEAWKWHTIAKRSGYEDEELDARFTKFLKPEARTEGDARATRWLETRKAAN